MRNSTSVAATLSVLAEPNRLRILELLREGPRPVGDIVGTLALHQPQVSKHLRVLNSAGLVEVQHDAQKRIYSLRAQPLKELDAWLQAYRSVWEESYDRLGGLLTEIQEMEKEGGSKNDS